jgi:hypothetical protein
MERVGLWVQAEAVQWRCAERIDTETEETKEQSAVKWIESECEAVNAIERWGLVVAAQRVQRQRQRQTVNKSDAEVG